MEVETPLHPIARKCEIYLRSMAVNQGFVRKTGVSNRDIWRLRQLEVTQAELQEAYDLCPM